jgi:two-component system OmpR family response regulator
MEPGTPISIVDYNEDALEAFRHALQGTHYSVSAYRTIGQALEQRADLTPGILIVDLDIWQALAHETRDKARARNKLIVSGGEDLFALAIEHDIAADDYIVKPINPTELIARLGCVLLRPASCSAECALARDNAESVRFESWTLDVGTFLLASDDGRKARLTSAEAGLLNVLLRSPNRILARDQLLHSNPLGDDSAFERSVDVLISRLRKKLEKDPSNPEIIKTIYGAGYQFGCDVKWLGGKRRKQPRDD